MDTLDDKEIESIWSRVKKYIDPQTLKASTREEFVRLLNEEMRSAGKAEGSQGSMRTLVAKGFAERLSGMQGTIKEYVVGAEKKTPIKVKAKEPEALPPVMSEASNNRYAISTRRGTRYYKQQNVAIYYGNFRGKPAFFVYNTRLGKRITWGVF